MKDYTLSEDQVAREAEAILEYVGTPRGWSAPHFTVHKLELDWELFWEPEAILRNTPWTARSSDIESMIVTGFLSLKEAFRLHQAALQDRDADAVPFTFEQLRTTIFAAFANVIAPLREITHGSAKLQWAGKQGGRPSCNREAICRDYDTWMSQNIPRPRVVTRLANKYATRKDVMNRILREEGRGMKQKVYPAKKS